MIHLLRILLVVIVAGFGWDVAVAEEVPKKAGTPGTGRTKTMSFDENVVEGLNKNPMDSLSHVGAQDDLNGARLYHRKPNFKNEIQSAVKDLRYSP